MTGILGAQGQVKEDIKHYYDDTLKFPHRWDKSWMAPTLSALLALSEQAKDNNTKHKQDPPAAADKPRR